MSNTTFLILYTKLKLVQTIILNYFNPVDAGQEFQEEPTLTLVALVPPPTHN